jgi:hypothetical protein
MYKCKIILHKCENIKYKCTPGIILKAKQALPEN